MTRHNAGFTLIELLVVLTIVAAMAAMALPQLGVGDGPSLRATTEQLAAELRLLRDEAIRTGEATALRSTAAGFVFEPSGRVIHLPPRTTVDVARAGPGLLPQGPPEAIEFYADGSATGSVVTLRRGRIEADIEIGWLDGSVRAHE